MIDGSKQRAEQWLLWNKGTWIDCIAITQFVIYINYIVLLGAMILEIEKAQ